MSGGGMMMLGMGGLHTLHLAAWLAVWLLICSSSAVAFTLKYHLKPGQQTGAAVTEEVGRLHSRTSHGFPTPRVNESLTVQADPHQESPLKLVNNKEVESGPDITYTSEQGEKFADDQTLKDGVYGHRKNEIGYSEALSQEVSQEDLLHSVPKMVVIVATTVVALFGMCVMAAIFQCCCRKKRTTSESESVDRVKEEKEEKSKSKSPSPSPEKEVAAAAASTEIEEKTENDKLLEDEDLGDFSAVQRETGILKSYRKPPPPKNRARASRAPRVRGDAAKDDFFSSIKEDKDVVSETKPASRRNSPEKSKDEARDTAGSRRSSPEKKLKVEVPKEDRRLSFEAAKQMVDSMLTEVKDKRETSPKLPESEEPRVRESETSHVKSVQPNGGNIFMQIDPTVRIRDRSEKRRSRTPVKSTAAPAPEPTPTAPEPTPAPNSDDGASPRPTSANKDQRKFLVPSVHGEQMDQLVKSLKTRLKDDKCQSARNLAVNKVVVAGDEEDLDPSSRERSHSDPMQNILDIKPTYV